MSYADQRTPAAYSISVAATHSWTLSAGDANPFTYVQLFNTHATQALSVQLNGVASFSLHAGMTQIYNARDVDITSVAISNPTSGATTGTVDVQVSYLAVAPTTATT